jgi:hypothetical protein
MTSGTYTQAARGLHATRLGPYSAATGATLGVIAGLVEFTVGPHIRPWIGNKQDTTRLGVATIALSAVALIAAVAWLRRNHTSTGARLLVLIALLVPGVICFTTVGRAWYIPGSLLAVASVVAAYDLREDAADVFAAISRNFLYILITVLAAFYILLGAAALGRTGVLGILGGAATIALVAAAGRLQKRLAVVLLIAGVAPFAVLTWWSIVSPLLAILVIAIGLSAAWSAPSVPRPAAKL